MQYLPHPGLEELWFCAAGSHVPFLDCCTMLKVTHVEFLSAVTGDRNYKQGLQQSEDSTVTTAAAICIPDSSASMKQFSRLLTASVA